MRDELRRMAMFGSGVVELTRYRAEQMVKGFVSSGDLSPAGAPAMVQELVERSRQMRKELSGFVREEIKNQIESLGLATKRDVERLERRVTRLEDNLKKVREDTSTVRSLVRRVDKLETAAEKAKLEAAAEKVKARPSTGTPVGDSPGTKPKSTAKKTTAKKTTAKKTTPKKTTAKKDTSRTSQDITDAPAPGAPEGTVS